MPDRNQTADLLKGIAILFMVQVHILELFAAEPVYKSDAGRLLLFFGGPLVAPVLMILFGYFIASSKRPAGQLIVRGVKIFALGMLLNLALNFNLIISVINGRIQENIWPYVFGADILHFAGLCLIVTGGLKNFFQQKLILTGVLCILFVLTGQYFAGHVPEETATQYLSAFFYGSAHWSYFPLFPWLAYPLAGMVFYGVRKKYDLEFPELRKTKLILCCVFIIFLVFTIQYAVSVASDLPLYYHHGIVFFTWVILFCSFYAFFINKLNRMAGESAVMSYIKWLGKNVTLIYVIQWIIIGNTATEIYKTISSPIYLAGCFFAVLVLSTGTAFGILKLNERFFKTSL